MRSHRLRPSRAEEKKKLRLSMTHDCELPPEENILVRYIDSGYFVDLRRNFRKLLMVSELNPRSKIFLKSTFAIRLEKEKHLQEYYYMIHPFSQLRFYWEVFMIFIFFSILVLIPIQMCYVEMNLDAVIIKIVLDALCIVDIFVTFNTGFQHPNTKKIIMSRRAVARHYLLGWFLLDVVTCLNIDVVILTAKHVDLSNLLYLKVISFLKIFRMGTLIKYTNRFRDYKQYSLYKFKMAQMVLVVFLLLLWCTCILYLVSRDANEPWLAKSHENISYRLLICFYQITNLFLLINTSSSNSVAVVGCELLFLVIGIILQLFLIGQFLQAVSKANTSSDKYRLVLNQMHDYMSCKNLPRVMVKRVIQYFTFRFQKNYFKEEEIEGTLTQYLRDEILMHSCQKMMESVSMFKDLPTRLVLQLTGCLQMEIFLPNDLIIHAEQEGTCMYFISSGTVAVYTPSGKEVCHLADGSSFGEISLVMKTRCIASVVAADYCDVFILHKKDFNAAIGPYPEFLQRTIAVAKRRMQRIISLERFRPAHEFYDFTTMEGIELFKSRLYEL